MHYVCVCGVLVLHSHPLLKRKFEKLHFSSEWEGLGPSVCVSVCLCVCAVGVSNNFSTPFFHTEINQVKYEAGGCRLEIVVL